MKSLLHLICDYAPGDLAWAEIAAHMAARLPENMRFHQTSVGSFDTIATGFAVAQLGLAGTGFRPEVTFIFANTAPRKDRRAARRQNEGEGLLWGTLDNGVEVIAVNSGHTLSFVKDHLTGLWTTKAPEKGSQFRSRDFFPQVVGQLVAGDKEFARRQLDVDKVVPDIPANVVAYIDSFGNLKTTIRHGDALLSRFNEGKRVKVTIGSTVRTATVSSGSFNIKEGDLAFAPGSSGHDRRFWELFKRGGSAWDEFHRPTTGMSISIE